MMSERVTRRVVVTGLGLITPLGSGVDKAWKALCDGKSGALTPKQTISIAARGDSADSA